MLDRPVDINQVLSVLPGAKRSGDQWMACCPAHEDSTPSLSIKVTPSGKLLFNCHHGCTYTEIKAALKTKHNLTLPSSAGPEKSKNRKTIVATYDYCDERNKLVFQKVRYEPKSFSLRRPDGAGGWIYNLKGVRKLVFRLPQLLASPTTVPVIIVEGEKDAINLAKLGFTVICNPEGASDPPKKCKWIAEYSEFLRGRSVYIVADNDPAGQWHARGVFESVKKVAKSVRIVNLPGLPPKGDSSDWLQSGGTREEFIRLAEAAPQGIPESPVQVTEDNADGKPAVSDGGELLVGERDPVSGKWILSEDQTLPTAQSIVKDFFLRGEVRTLHFYADRFLEWRDGCYREIEERAVKQKIQAWLHEQCVAISEKQVLEQFNSNSRTVNASFDALQSYLHLRASTPSPSWIGEAPEGLDPKDILVGKSVMLHLPTGRKLPVTPKFFTTSSLSFDPDPEAPEPSAWFNFLVQVFGEDTESINELWKWFGYVLTGDTSQQKMLLIVGPKRSGKGTIARVLRKLVGEGNVAGPTVSSLAGNFGLQPLIDKTLAILSDARFGGEGIREVCERLLCISGEDSLTIHRKHMAAVDLKLPTRMMFLTNELPRLNDASGALASRFVMLRLRNSFYGKEDHDLERKLLAELPGILNWSIEGWDKLRREGRFKTPSTAEDEIRELEDLSSPVSAFVREECNLNPEDQCPINELYQAWGRWCERDGRQHQGDKALFCRNLRAAFPALQRRRSTYLTAFYQGISLKGTTIWQP